MGGGSQCGVGPAPGVLPAWLGVPLTDCQGAGLLRCRHWQRPKMCAPRPCCPLSNDGPASHQVGEEGGDLGEYTTVLSNSKERGRGGTGMLWE